MSIRSESPSKLLGLELVRFAAALAVLFWHYQNFWFTPDGLIGFVRQKQPLYPYFQVFFDFGKYGVQVFWSISGYIFFWKYRESIAAGRVGAWTFFVLRFSRLYPLHLATLLLVAALQLAYVQLKGASFVYGYNDPFHFVLQLFLASNWGFQVASSFNGPIWSISLEILVYIAFFVVLRWLGASLLWSAAILIGAAAAYVLGGHNSIFACFTFFYLGGVTATLAATSRANDHRKALLAAALVVLIGVPAAASQLPPGQLGAVAPVLAIGYLPAFLYVMAEHFRIPRLLWNPVQVAGNMTYSSYLIHFPLQLCIATVCAARGNTIPTLSPVFFLAYMGTVLLLAWLVFRWFEKPCQALIRRSFASPRTATTASMVQRAVKAPGGETQTPGWHG